MCFDRWFKRCLLLLLLFYLLRFFSNKPLCKLNFECNALLRIISKRSMDSRRQLGPYIMGGVCASHCRLDRFCQRTSSGVGLQNGRAHVLSKLTCYAFGTHWREYKGNVYVYLYAGAWYVRGVLLGSAWLMVLINEPDSKSEQTRNKSNIWNYWLQPDVFNKSKIYSCVFWRSQQQDRSWRFHFFQYF